MGSLFVKDKLSFQFAAENALPKNQRSLLRPGFSIQLFSGNNDHPSPFTQDEAIGLWDAIIDSMRLSPANGGNRVDDETGGLVPTTRVGEVCPKSGVWEASRSGNDRAAHVLANWYGRFKKVEQGQLMPPVYSTQLFPQTADADNARITWSWCRKA